MRFYFILCSGLLIYAGRSLAQQNSQGIRFSACVGRPTPPADFYQGKFLVLDFWATWCGPCIEAMPHLKEIAAYYATDSRIVFATMTSESASKVAAMWTRKPKWYLTDYPLIDSAGYTSAYYGIHHIPQTLVFNEEGELVFSGHTKRLTVSLLDSLLEGKKEIPPVMLQTVEVEATPDWRKVAVASDYFVRFEQPDTTSENEMNELYVLNSGLWFYGENLQLSNYLELLSAYPRCRMYTKNPELLNQRLDCCLKLPLKTGSEPGYEARAMLIFSEYLHFRIREINHKTDVRILRVQHSDSLAKYTSLSDFGKTESWNGEEAMLTGFTLTNLTTFLESNDFWHNDFLTHGYGCNKIDNRST